MNERIRKLRKYLDMTQQKFADQLGVARNNIAGYETCKRSPSDAVISLICREFNVNEDWLRYGTGEMFCQLSEDDEFLKATESIVKNNDVEIMSLLVEYWKLDEVSKDVFRNYLRNVSKRIETTETKDNSMTIEEFKEIYNSIPDTPEELEKLYPPIEIGRKKAR